MGGVCLTYHCLPLPRLLTEQIVGPWCALLNERIDGWVGGQTNTWEGGQARCAWRTLQETGHLYWGVNNAKAWEDCWRWRRGLWYKAGDQFVGRKKLQSIESKGMTWWNWNFSKSYLRGKWLIRALPIGTNWKRYISENDLLFLLRLKMLLW